MQNDNLLIDKLNKTINKIKLNSKDLNIIFREKKYYDKFIGIYLEKTAKYILKNLENNKTDFLYKMNIIFFV